MNLLTEFWNILSNPAEYGPIIILMSVFFGMVTVVCVIALLGWRATYTWGRARPRLNLAVTASAVLLSLSGLTLLNAEFYLEVDQVRRAFDLKWLFIVPAILSGFALRRWLALHRRDVTPDERTQAV